MTRDLLDYILRDENIPANPDNILALNDGTLLIGEDAGKKKHVLDMLRMVK